MANPTNPTDIGRWGHRQGLYLNSAGSIEQWIDRVQTADPEFDAGVDTFFEIGNNDPVGFAQQPSRMRLTWNENVVQAESDFILAGANPAVASMTYHMGNVLNNVNNINAYLVMRANGATVPTSELAFTSMGVEELNWSFQVRNPITFTPRLSGTVGKWYQQAGLIHSTWGTLNTSSPGAIMARDARIFFYSNTGRAYRLQSFNIRTQFPITQMEEIGNRQIVGQISGQPKTLIDFDIAVDDDQPNEQFATLTSNYYDYNNLLTGIGVWIKVYDPTAAEATSVIRSWKAENVVAVRANPLRVNAKGVAMARWSLIVSKATTAGSGGLTVGKGDIS